MKVEGSRVLATVLSIVGVPLAFAFFTHVSYRAALASGIAPYSIFGSAGVWPALWLAVLAGLLGLIYGLVRLPNLRFAACAIYVVVMPIILFVMGYVVGCANGDC